MVLLCSDRFKIKYYHYKQEDVCDDFGDDDDDDDSGFSNRLHFETDNNISQALMLLSRSIQMSTMRHALG